HDRQLDALEKLVEGRPELLRLGPVDLVTHHAVLAIERLSGKVVALLPRQRTPVSGHQSYGQQYREKSHASLRSTWIAPAPDMISPARPACAGLQRTRNRIAPGSTIGTGALLSRFRSSPLSHRNH